MRLFVALPVGGDAERELAGMIREHEGTNWPVRWVGVDGLHLTMKFLGETESAMLPKLESLLRQAAHGTPALSLAPREFGGFPTLAKARVLWAGYEAEPALELLAHRVEDGCAALGFPVEGRPFRPHVTVGRIREGRTLSHAAVERIEAWPLQKSLFADRLVLYQSVTGTNRAEYHPLVTIALGG